MVQRGQGKVEMLSFTIRSALDLLQRIMDDRADQSVIPSCVNLMLK